MPQASQPNVLFGPVALGQKVRIPNGHVMVSAKKIEVTQRGVKFELVRNYDKQAKAMKPW